MNLYVRLHGHHEYPDGIPFELVWQTLAQRKRFIMHKPKEERTLRLRLIRNVKVKLLPKPLQRATEKAEAAARAVDKAEAAAERAEARWLDKDSPELYYEVSEKVWDLYFQLKQRAGRAEENWRDCAAKHKKALDKLHKKLCKKDCPWNGCTIFPVKP